MTRNEVLKPKIEICLRAKEWSVFWPKSAQNVRAILYHALKYFPFFTGKISVSVLLTDDAEIKELNCKYRHKDKPTNVLSFPACKEFSNNAEEYFLGDIALALETTVKEAQEKAISLEKHAAHLLIHGLLHLLGYDHKKNAEAERMEALEALILQDYLSKNKVESAI